MASSPSPAGGIPPTADDARLSRASHRPHPPGPPARALFHTPCPRPPLRTRAPLAPMAPGILGCLSSLLGSVTLPLTLFRVLLLPIPGLTLPLPPPAAQQGSPRASLLHALPSQPWPAHQKTLPSCFHISFLFALYPQGPLPRLTALTSCLPLLCSSQHQVPALSIYNNINLFLLYLDTKRERNIVPFTGLFPKCLQAGTGPGT